MNPIDKAAIAWSIGIAAAFVAFAASDSLRDETADAAAGEPGTAVAGSGMVSETAGVPAGGPMPAVTVHIRPGTDIPGCELTGECYVPSAANVTLGGTVTWINGDDAAHTATGGTPQAGPTLEFDSSLIPQGASYSATFEAEGSYRYFCLVHPWMSGAVNVG